MKYLAICSLILLSTFNSFAQNAPDIIWEVTLELIDDSDSAILVLTADVPKGLHIYSSDFECEIGPNPTSLKSLEENGAELSGDLLSIGAKTTYDDIFMCDLSYFDVKAELHQKFLLTESEASLSGVLEYQVCLENGMCILREQAFDVSTD